MLLLEQKGPRSMPAPLGRALLVPCAELLRQIGFGISKERRRAIALVMVSSNDIRGSSSDVLAE